jgi:hypothetical protein
VAISVDQLVAELRGFDGRREVVKAIGRGIRKGVPPVARAIRERALATLPHRGGLGAWVAASKVTARISLSGRRGSVKLKAGRNSSGGRSDIRAIDDGRVRAPAWGRRGASWHTQSVTPGFFTQTAAASKDWYDGVDQAVDEALNTLRR